MSELIFKYKIHKIKVKFEKREHLQQLALFLKWIIEKPRVALEIQQQLAKVFNIISQKLSGEGEKFTLTIDYPEAIEIETVAIMWTYPNDYTMAIVNQVKDEINKQRISITP